MAKSKKQSQARELRKKGYSIKDIAKLLRVSKGSVSTWCSEIMLTSKQKESLHEKMVKAGHRGRMIGALMNKKKRERRLEMAAQEAKKEIPKLSKKDVLMVALGLYWGEGSKSRRFVFSNSDPHMILFIMKWLGNMGITQEDLIVRVLINEIHKSRIEEVLRFWKGLLNLSDRQFRKTTFVRVKPKKVYENYNNYYGTLKLSVRKSSQLQNRVLALIERLKNVEVA